MDETPQDELDRRAIVAELYAEWLKGLSPKARQNYEDEKFLTPIQLADSLSITPQVIYTYARHGRIGVEYTKTDHKIIPRVEVDAFLNKRFGKEAKRQQQLENELRGL